MFLFYIIYIWWYFPAKLLYFIQCVSQHLAHINFNFPNFFNIELIFIFVLQSFIYLFIFYFSFRRSRCTFAEMSSVCVPKITSVSESTDGAQDIKLNAVWTKLVFAFYTVHGCMTILNIYIYIYYTALLLI